MLRQASSRNQRNKGFKLKHALQFFVLLAISIWLLFQVKHSYDKKMAFEKNNLKNSNRLNDYVPSISKLGRKDLYHKNGLIITKEDHQEEEVEQEEEEEEEIRQEDENSDEKRGDGVLEELDQEKEDEEAERGEDFGEEEENERKEFDGEADLFKKQIDSDEIDMDSQKIQYDPDDASNSKLSNTQLLKSESDNIHSEELKIDVSIKNSSIDENLSNKTEDTSGITMKDSDFDKLVDEQVVRTERNNGIGEKIKNESTEENVVLNEKKRMEKLGQDQVESNEHNRTEDVKLEKIIHEPMDTQEVKEKEIALSSSKPHPNFIGVGKIEQDDSSHGSINLTESREILSDVSYERVNGTKQIDTYLGSEINAQHKLTVKYPTKQNDSVTLAEKESLIYSIMRNETAPIESSRDQRDQNVMVEVGVAKSLWLNSTEESRNSSITINPAKEEENPKSLPVEIPTDSSSMQEKNSVTGPKVLPEITNEHMNSDSLSAQ